MFFIEIGDFIYVGFLLVEIVVDGLLVIIKYYGIGGLVSVDIIIV